MKADQKLSELVPKEALRCNPRRVHVFDWALRRPDLFVPQKCSMPWCSDCEPIRVGKLKVKIRKYLEHNWLTGSSLWIVTRSVRNDFGLERSFNALRLAQQAWTKQLKSRDNLDHPLRSVDAWIATTEIKHSATKGYNVHEHAIWQTQTDRIDFSAAHKYWDRAAGFKGAHINLKKVRDITHAINYVAKYLSKGVWGGLSVGRAYRVASVLKGRNRINSKHGTIPPKGFTSYSYCCSSVSVLGRGECCNEAMSGIQSGDFSG